MRLAVCREPAEPPDLESAKEENPPRRRYCRRHRRRRRRCRRLLRSRRWAWAAAGQRERAIDQRAFEDALAVYFWAYRRK